MVGQRQMALVDKMVRPVGPRPAVTTAVLTPKEVFGILRRHILLIVILTGAGLIIGGGAWYLLKEYAPKYTAETYLRVLPPVEKDPTAIVSPQVAKDIQYGHRLSMAGLIKQQSTLQELLGRDKIKETKWFERRDRSILKAVKDLESRFRVSAQRDGDFIELSMTCGDDEESALIVNEMVDLFLRSQGDTKREDVAERLARLEEQRVRVQRDLDSAERAISDVRTATGLTDLDTERRYFQHTITLRLNSLELQHNDLILGISQVQADIKNLEGLATGPINEQIEHQIETDPVMVMLAQQRDFRGAQLAGMLTKFGENHKVVRETQELINVIKEKRTIRKAEIAEQTRQANYKNAQDMLIVLQERLEELTKLREEASAKKRELDLARAQYERRMAIRDERKDMLDSMKEQIEKLRIIHDDPETPKVQFVGFAPVPLEVSSPRWEFYYPGGTVLGLLFGVGFVFLIELLNDLVRLPRDVGRYLHIPLLAVIPDAAADEQARGVDLCHVVRQAPYSIVSESYRQFRTNLKLSSSAESLKTLLVSSGMPGDGKTSVAVNLATTFVAENKKVLLIDANFRRPSLHTIFPRAAAEPDIGELGEMGEMLEQAEFGLSNLLMGQCGYHEVVRPTDIEGFAVIDSGPLPPNPAELLDSRQMQELVKTQRENYDYIIIDGPPVLLVSEAKVLARLVDGTVLVFNAGTTRRGAAQRVIRELKEINATIVGSVLFAVKSMKGGYFQEQFKSYQQYQKAQVAQPIS